MPAPYYGLTEVFGVRRNWLSKDAKYIDSKETVIWNWKAPAIVKADRVSSGYMQPYERCAAYVTYPKLRDNRNPLVFFFDAETGMKWQQEIPMLAATAEIRSSANISIKDVKSNSDFCNTGVCVTPDGSRVLVMVNRPDLYVSALFVYDKQGVLLKTVGFPMHVSLSCGNHFSNRSKSGYRFFHQFAGSQKEDKNAVSATARRADTILFDADGNMLGRFADEDGTSFKLITDISEDNTYALGAKEETNGYVDCLFKLPKSAKEAYKNQADNK